MNKSSTFLGKDKNSQNNHFKTSLEKKETLRRSGKVLDKFEIGKLGEKIAGRFMENKKYQIIANNFKVRGGEIDLVCRRGSLLVFVEVKTRTGLAFGYPEESFNWRKRKKLLFAIKRYLLKTGYQGGWQVDLLAIELNQREKSAKIRHYQGVGLEDY